MIQALTQKLSRGGIIIIATPNPAAFQLKLFRSRWTHIDAPRHVMLIPMSVLRRRLHEMGLEEVLVTARDQDSVGLNNFGWQHSLKNLATRTSTQTALMFAGKILTRLFHPIETTGSRGSCYTAVFRKRR